MAYINNPKIKEIDLYKNARLSKLEIINCPILEDVKFDIDRNISTEIIRCPKIKGIANYYNKNNNNSGTFFYLGKGCSELERMELYGLSIITISSYTFLSLKRVTFSRINFLNVDLHMMPNLEYLSLYKSKFSDMRTTSNNIKTIGIKKCSFKTLTLDGNNKTLKTLMFYDNNFKEFNVKQPLSNLLELEISNKNDRFPPLPLSKDLDNRIIIKVNPKTTYHHSLKDIVESSPYLNIFTLDEDEFGYNFSDVNDINFY